MKVFNCLKLVILVLLCQTAFAQVQINRSLQLTGNGGNARVSGIHAVIDTADAPNVTAIQNGSLIYAPATGSANNFVLNITPGITAYTEGMAFSFKSNQINTGPVTVNVNNLGGVPVKKNVNMDLAGCEIETGQMVTVIYDGTNFQMTSRPASNGLPPTTANAGPDQLNLEGDSVALAGNNPSSGTGTWSIISGTGGSLQNPNDSASLFYGLSDSAYTLVWTIATASCGSSSDTVNISFAGYISGTQTFSTPGGPYTFTVSNNVTSLTIQCWGAQGQGDGGLGGYATGTLAVTQGQQLFVYVGGQDGTNGGGYGNSGYGGGGSDIRQGSTSLSSRIIVAGGGGGGYGNSYPGGAGGGTTGGTSGYSYPAGNNATGGTQTTGGTWGGGFGYGAPSDPGVAGSGGGGGWYGGGSNDRADGAPGSGVNTAGGGGSGYIGGVANASMQTGVQTGNGQVVISW